MVWKAQSLATRPHTATTVSRYWSGHTSACSTCMTSAEWPGLGTTFYFTVPIALAA